MSVVVWLTDVVVEGSGAENGNPADFREAWIWPSCDWWAVEAICHVKPTLQIVPKKAEGLDIHKCNYNFHNAHLYIIARCLNESRRQVL